MCEIGMPYILLEDKKSRKFEESLEGLNRNCYERKSVLAGTDRKLRSL